MLNYFAETSSGSEEGSYFRRIDFVSLNPRLESNKKRRILASVLNVGQSCFILFAWPKDLQNDEMMPKVDDAGTRKSSLGFKCCGISMRSQMAQNRLRNFVIQKGG
jgi:hypothetical protein